MVALPVHTSSTAPVPAVSTDAVQRQPRAPRIAVGNVGDDAALVAALCEGARWAPGVLYGRYAGAVEHLIVRLLGGGPDVDDVFQDVFVAAFRGIRELRDPLRLRSWLLRIAVLSVRDHLRSRRRRRWLVFFEPERMPEVPSLPTDDCREAVERAYRLFDRMSPNDRIPFLMHLLTDMDLAEIAESCETSLATVKRRIVRAELWFRKQAHKDTSLRPWLRQEPTP